ncbi:Acyl-homoserine lactone acylase QuiP [Diplonema papillatum]|nr:Acyl-homoserine lactone acylase QuiP [Diplonema papillatum]
MPAPRGYCGPIVAAALVAGIAAVAAGCNPLAAFVAGIDWAATRSDKATVLVASLKSETVEIYRDPATGMLHIIADNEHDAVFGQGYAQAHDRLFQLDVLRRAAAGTLAELVGEAAVPLDKWSRTVGYSPRGDEDWEIVLETDDKADIRRYLRAFMDGINAYIKEHSAFWQLPVEYVLLREKPQLFEPRDTLRFMRLHATAMNKGWQNELLFAELFAKVDPQIVNALRSAVAYDSENLAGGMGSTLQKAHEVNPTTDLVQSFKDMGWDTKELDANPFVAGATEGGGSNAWVISGRYTASGKPILANDPHLPFTLPSIWHSTRLTIKDIDLDQMGLACPLVPYMVVSYNGHIAFGATLARIDADDVFIEKISQAPDGTKLYLDSDGAKKPVESRTEYIRVKGVNEAIPLTVEETRRGPLVCGMLNIAANVTGGEEMDCSLSSLSLQKKAVIRDAWGASIPSDALRTLTHAKDYAGFRRGVEGIVTCNMNMVFSDKNGDIGYQMCGRSPVRTEILDTPREGWNPAHQWLGWVPFDRMPHALNPERGYIVSANQKPYPDADGTDVLLGNLWQHGWRAKRVEELLLGAAAAGKLTLADSVRWQRDLTSIPARTFAAAAREAGDSWVSSGTPADPNHGQIRAMVEIVRSWNGSMTVESSAAVVYASVKEHLLRNLLHAALPDKSMASRVLGIGQLSVGKLSNDLDGRHSAFFLRVLSGDPSAGPLVAAAGKPVPRLVYEAFGSAYAAVSAHTGERAPGKWRWGAVHPASFVHPLGKGDGVLSRLFNVNVGPVPGDADTLNLAAYIMQDEDIAGLPKPKALYQQRGFAASARLVVEHAAKAHESECYHLVAPGNSGRPSSPHFSDKADVLTCSEREGIDHTTRPTYDAEKRLEILLTRQAP